tara:strand:- start:1699 stop:1950 length:252 start_codon:yes stop_codon:yes gene_type:complete
VKRTVILDQGRELRALEPFNDLFKTLGGDVRVQLEEDVSEAMNEQDIGVACSLRSCSIGGNLWPVYNGIAESLEPLKGSILDY